MFSRIAKPLRVQQAINKFSTSSQNNVNVTILGAAGGIGQPLSLLLKQSPLITRLHLYDIRHTLGVAADLSHIETPAKVTGFNGPEKIGEALKDSEIVVIPAGMPRKPGMTRDDLFGANASVTYDLANAIAKYAPNAIVGIITNPVNSTVPIASEVMIKNNCYDPRKILGVSTLDTVRANTFIAELNGWDPVEVNVPVIGGHSGITIIPLLSQAKPPVKMQPDDVKKLFARVQEAGTEVVKAKDGAGSATLSMAFAAARFTNKLCQALKGATDIVECAYIRSDVVPGVKYFATPILFGKNGVEKNLGLPPLDAYEKAAVQLAIPELQKEIAKGEEFGKNKK